MPRFFARMFRPAPPRSRLLRSAQRKYMRSKIDAQSCDCGAACARLLWSDDGVENDRFSPEACFLLF